MAGLHFRGVQGFHNSRRSPPAPVLSREQGARQALFGTLPGRAIIVGLAIKLLVVGVGAVTGRVPVFVSVVDTVAGIAITAGTLYSLFRLLVLAKRRLLWRVRRKLILSYVFIGFIPAILIAAFFLLCGLLLFYTFRSYLVQGRLRAIEDQGRLVAESTAIKIQRASGRDLGAVVRRKQEDAGREFPGASMAVVPVNRPCAQTDPGPAHGTAAESRPPVIAGPWAHGEPPRTLPGWIGCSGFSGLLAYSHATLRPFDVLGVAPSKVEGRQAEGALGSRTENARAPIVVNGQSVDLSGSVEDTHMFVRAAAFPDSPTPDDAVVVDLLVNNDLTERLKRETGVEVKSISAVDLGDQRDAKPIAGRDGGDSPARRSTSARPRAPQLGDLSRIPRVEHRQVGHAARLDRAEHRRDLRPDRRRPGSDRQSQLRSGAAARPARRGRLVVPRHQPNSHVAARLDDHR